MAEEVSSSSNATLTRKIDDLSATVNRLSQQFSDYLAARYDSPTQDNQQQSYALKEIKPKDEVDDYTQDFSKDENEDRGNWSGRLDFLLACLGYAVGLGNVWRFPYLCYKNGGAVFFIPYVIMLVFVGMPIFVLELSLGQYTSSGPVTCWEMSLLFKGVGVGMVGVSCMVAIYYNMIIAWSLYYLFASFTSDLPWQYCDKDWNTPFCGKLMDDNITNAADCQNMNHLVGADGVCRNTSGTPVAIWDETIAKENGYEVLIPTEEYLQFEVWHIQDADGVDDLGPLQWQLVLCLLLAWIIVVASLIKGVKSSGKVVYFTALFPYLVLIILFFRGITLDGASEGIDFYILNTDTDKLSDAQVWKDAASQIFFSLSASWGGLIALASYNRFHNDCIRDSIIVSIGNCLTSFFAGFVIFSFLGFLAKEYNKEVSDVAKSGVGLAFTVYPDAVLHLDASPLWAILFFLMLITLGLDSEFALVETVTTSLFDQWPQLRNHKAKVTICIGIILFLLGLDLCTAGGSWMLSLIDNYAGSWNVLLLAVLECICISYVYGPFRFKEDIRLMIGKNGCNCFPWDCCFPWWMVNWAFFTPLGVTFVMVFSWVDYSPYVDGDYEYPDWANALGWLMALTTVVAVIVTPIILFFARAEGSFVERIRYLTVPTKYWGPALVKHRRRVRHLPVPYFEVDPWGEMDQNMENGIRTHDSMVDGKDNLAYNEHM